MNTGSEPSLWPVLPTSFWTYLAFQLPSDQVADLRAALNHPGQRFRGWYRQEWSIYSYIMAQSDGPNIVLVDETGDVVKFADDDKCVAVSTCTGRFVAMTRSHIAPYKRIDVRVLLQRAMRRWYHRRKQRRDATAQALAELRLLIPDLYPLAVSYIGSG